MVSSELASARFPNDALAPLCTPIKSRLLSRSQVRMKLAEPSALPYLPKSKSGVDRTRGLFREGNIIVAAGDGQAGRGDGQEEDLICLHAKEREMVIILRPLDCEGQTEPAEHTEESREAIVRASGPTVIALLPRR